MTDELLSELLERSVEAVPTADAPLGDLLERGHAARRSRRRTTAVGAALACLLVIGGAGAVRWAAHPEPLPAVGQVAAMPQPPAGTKWVGVGRTVVAVPASWPVIPGVYCAEPRSPYVTIIQWHAAAGCEPILRPPVASISIEATATGGFAATGARSGAVTLPQGWLAVPAGGDAGGVGAPSLTSEIAALKAAGFVVERRTAAMAGAWRQVTTDPEIGTPAHVGGTVIVYDHGAVPSSATLSGRLLWVGGPAPGTPRPHAGTVHVVNADDSVDQTAAAGADGRWTIYLPPGTYRIMATSPGFLSDQGSPDACASAHQVTLGVGGTETSDVYC